MAVAGPDGDGRPDMTSANTGGSVSVWVNSTGSTAPVITTPAPGSTVTDSTPAFVGTGTGTDINNGGLGHNLCFNPATGPGCD